MGACSNAIPQMPLAFPVNVTVTWRIVKDGMIVIYRPDLKIREVWKIDLITANTHLGSTNLNKGDLLMQLYAANGDGLIYMRALRRV
ncbi:MAG: hypothetical protein C0428_14335 [Polaromonas sp.]|nr:hypothetical protein [Polaromonas sp.]